VKSRRQPDGDLCRAVLAAREEVYRLQIAALMPGLTPGQIKLIRRQERIARTKRRAAHAALQAERRRFWEAVQLELPLRRTHMSNG
jgi:hypothetical protein